MVPDVRSSAGEVSFDLLTPEGVIQALAAVRSSLLPAEAKRELRDKIFSYTNSGGDPALRTEIEALLVTLPKSPSRTEASPQVVAAPIPEAEPAPEATVVTVPTLGRVRSGFRTGRPAPQFRVLTTSPVIEPMTQSAPVVPQRPEPVPTSQPTPDPVPVPMVPKAVVDEVLAPLSTPSAQSVEYRPPYQESPSADAARDRISAIKQMVNAKVGNPVNLVDMDNTIGRAYMSALLEAMKAVSGGGGDIAATMAQLELVVRDVEKLFSSQAPARDVVSVIEPVAPNPVVPITPIVPSAPTVSEVAVPIPQKAVAEPLETAEAVWQTRSSVPVVSADPTTITPMAIASSRFKNVLPVTAQEPLKTPADLPTAAEVKARSGITDPLQDPDVDLGLEQLLGEWSLFKKSGMFGTGPKGRQHPLFLKLATIPMPLILSGRFEGSTSEIRQSITDYMNGWRYEQGIIYEQNETFEHYLRRVIRHIIDSQTRRRGA